MRNTAWCDLSIQPQPTAGYRYEEHWDQPEHITRLGHFCVLSDEERLLLPDFQDRRFKYKDCYADVRLLDKWNQVIFNAREVIAFEQDGDHYTLDKYFFYWHYCPCHREGSITGDDSNHTGECEEGRWIVLSITHPNLPNVNLYYETENTTEEYQEWRAKQDW